RPFTCRSRGNRQTAKEVMMLDNLVIWCAQIAIVCVTAAVIRWVARMNSAPVRLTYWQSVLLVCLFLPVLQPWKQVVAEGTVRVVSIIRSAHLPSARTAHISWPFLLLAGTLLRLAWFATGFWRLQRLRRDSELFAQQDGAELRISETISSPA